MPIILALYAKICLKFQLKYIIPLKLGQNNSTFAEVGIYEPTTTYVPKSFLFLSLPNKTFIDLTIGVILFFS